MEPSAANVALAIEDWTKKPPYASANIFTTAPLPDALFEKIKRSPLSNHVKSFKELNIDFLVLESQVFLLDRKPSIYSIYNPQSQGSLTKELVGIAKQLASMLGTLGEIPYIRYYDPPKGTPLAYQNLSSSIKRSLCGQLAFALDKEIKGLNLPSSTADRPTILIVDRSIDVLAPLIHEFSYQALMGDVIMFKEGGKIEWDGEGSVNGLVQIDERNSVWVDTRHKHIAEASDFVVQGFQKFTSDNKAAQYSAGKETLFVYTHAENHQSSRLL